MSAPNRRKLNHKIDCENPIKIQIKKLEKEIESNNVILSRLNVEAEILKLRLVTNPSKSIEENENAF
jgi:hypothetical protein